MLDLKIIERFYASFPAKVDNARTILSRPLTYTEKILFGHLNSESSISTVKRGSSYNDFNPDRVAMQDATSQMALLQFMMAGKDKSDYDKIREDDTLSLIDLDRFSVGRELILEMIHSDSSSESIVCDHTFNEAQIEWFKAGSALNLIRTSQ